MHYALRDGVRETASEAYLKPLRNMSNLLVQTGALVTKVYINISLLQI